MIRAQGELKKWGSSIGLILPKKEVIREGLKPGQKVDYLVTAKDNPLEKTFGMDKFSKPISRILKEVDKEAWDE
ncbi:MAG: hypothetical protein Q7S21_01790 [archaeon]|nr:hypothetical protein [archaeon]